MARSSALNRVSVLDEVCINNNSSDIENKETEMNVHVSLIIINAYANVCNLNQLYRLLVLKASKYAVLLKVQFLTLKLHLILTQMSLMPRIRHLVVIVKFGRKPKKLA